MNYADIKYPDIANGSGVRVSLFVSGCNRHCPGCFNQEAQDFNYGNPFTDTQVSKIMELLKPNYVAGLSILGGEPLELSNLQELSSLVKLVKETYPDKNIWCYTGDTFEIDVLPKIKKYKFAKEFFKYIDVLVDGDFILDKKDVSLVFKGSSNQRLLDAKKSVASKKPIIYELVEYYKL